MTFSRATYRWLVAAAAAFLAYGSLVPFDFDGITWTEAFQRFADTLVWPLSIDSRTDFVTNILISIPISYFGMAALGTDRAWRTRASALLIVLPGAAALAVVVEFAQVFFPIRTDAFSDIVAQVIGAVAGALAWLLVGETVTRWLRESIEEREAPALIQRLLLLYGVLFAISQLMPLDLTLNLGELARKYRNGGINLVPFTFVYASRFEQAWDMIGAVVLNSPIGAAAVLVGTRRGRRRRFLPALTLAVLAVGAIECTQVFVMTRVADTTDFILGVIGVSIGVALTGILNDRATAPPTRRRQPRSVVLGWEAVFLWTCVLISYHWSPFDFTASASQVTEGMHLLTATPFESYYVGDQFHAFNEIVRKSTLGVPLGITLAFALSSNVVRSFRSRVILAWGLGVTILLAIEIGQVFVPSRVPDITDPLVGGAGTLVGFLLTDRLRALASRSSES